MFRYKRKKLNNMRNWMKNEYDLPIEVDSVLWEVVRMCESMTGKDVTLHNASNRKNGGLLMFYYGDKGELYAPLVDAIKARLGDRIIDIHDNPYMRYGMVKFRLKDCDFPQETGNINESWKDDEDEGNTYAHKLQEVKAIKVERYNVEKLINFVGGGQMTITRGGTAVFSFLNNGAAYLDAPEHSYIVRVGESRFKVVPDKEFENEWELK